MVALAVVCMGQLMMVLDGTIVNVALPSMQRDLGFSQANLAWVLDAYMIAFGSFLLLAGRLGDLLGRKRMFLTGVVMFTLASVACGLAGDQLVLIVARFVQGLGGAVASAAVLALLVTEFPRPSERAIAMSVYRSSSPAAVRSGCSPAACSRSRSTGTGSFSSTCRSGS